MQPGLHSLCLLRMAQIHHRLEDTRPPPSTPTIAALWSTGARLGPAALANFTSLARLAPDIGRLGAPPLLAAGEALTSIGEAQHADQV
ncbi:MAG: hypothetical protein R2854_19495 [Caldilineaceae bacterium]